MFLSLLYNNQELFLKLFHFPKLIFSHARVWGYVLAGKCRCSVENLGLIPRTHLVAHHHPYLWSEGIQCPIVVSSVTRHTYGAHIHADKTLIHLKSKINTYFKKNMQLQLMN